MAPSRSRKRRFQPVKVDTLGNESGGSRFTKDGLHSPPQISPWRNNLTALSQRYNLYFVASGDKIHVYVPEFFSQTLGSTPRLVLSPQPAEPHAQGYLNEAQPHGINHLVVGDLGRDEILVVTTDSGNVAAYHTSTIARTVERGAKKDLSRPADDAGLRPFFTHWVFESAWGIAIHKAARLVAISANVPHRVDSDALTAKITVFAFALTSRCADDRDHGISDYDRDVIGSEEEEWIEIKDQAVLHEQLMFRTRNVKLVLSEHKANIPNVAFVNNHLDRQGKWLISTDIDGEMKVWRVWDREVYRSYDFSQGGWGTRLSRRQCEMGWSVLGLDPASFRKMDTMEEFCGEAEPSEYYPSSSGSYVGGPRESYLLGSLTAFMDDSDDESEILEQPLLAVNISDDEDEGIGGVSLLGDVEDAPNESPAQAEPAGRGVSGDAHDRRVSNDSEEVPIHRTQRPLNLDTLMSGAGTYRPGRLLLLEQEDTSTMTLTETTTVESEEELSEAAHHDRVPSGSFPVQLLSPQSQIDSLLSTRRAGPRTDAPDADFPNFPILHCSVSNIRLTKSPQAFVPHVFLAEPLVQYFPPSIAYLYNMERLSMTAYLPDIGVVVIASQAGKVVLLTLTKRAKTGCLGVRMDRILPSDEEEGAVPKYTPLLGIAASPIQGEPPSPNSSSNSSIDDEITYGTDQNVDGIPCTFDHDFLCLDARHCIFATPFSDSSDSDDESVEQQRTDSQATTTLLPHRNVRTPPKRKTLSPRTRAARQLPTPPRGGSSLTSARSSKVVNKKLRTNVVSSSSVPATASSAAKSSPESSSFSSKFPTVSAPWTRSDRILKPLIDGGQPKRYRLLLTYYDHTVLSYEIRRIDEKLGIWGSGRRNWENKEDVLI